jgi:uncharacterized protein (DUF1778 family)
MAPNPRKNPDITIRLSPEEREAIDRAAEADHLSSSTWLRRIALFGAEDTSPREAQRERVASLTARMRGGEAPPAAKAARRAPRGRKR